MVQKNRPKKPPPWIKILDPPLVGDAARGGAKCELSRSGKRWVQITGCWVNFYHIRSTSSNIGNKSPVARILCLFHHSLSKKSHSLLRIYFTTRTGQMTTLKYPSSQTSKIHILPLPWLGSGQHLWLWWKGEFGGVGVDKKTHKNKRGILHTSCSLHHKYPPPLQQFSLGIRNT